MLGQNGGERSGETHGFQCTVNLQRQPSGNVLIRPALLVSKSPRADDGEAFALPDDRFNTLAKRWSIGERGDHVLAISPQNGERCEHHIEVGLSSHVALLVVAEDELAVLERVSIAVGVVDALGEVLEFVGGEHHGKKRSDGDCDRQS